MVRRLIDGPAQRQQPTAPTQGPTLPIQPPAPTKDRHYHYNNSLLNLQHGHRLRKWSGLRRHVRYGYALLFRNEHDIKKEYSTVRIHLLEAAGYPDLFKNSYFGLLDDPTGALAILHFSPYGNISVMVTVEDRPSLKSLYAAELTALYHITLRNDGSGRMLLRVSDSVRRGRATPETVEAEESGIPPKEKELWATLESTALK